MRPLVALAVCLAACGPKEPPSAPVSAPPASSAPAHDDPNRNLTRAECESLAGAIVEVCEKRGNSRVQQIERYCADFAHGVAPGGKWFEVECLPHVRFIDATCIHGATSVESVMDCERGISR